VTYFPLRYGEMVINDNATATTINSQDTWEKIVAGWTSDELDGVAFNTDQLEIEAPANYAAWASMTATPANDVEYEFGIGVNGTPVDDTAMSQNFGATSAKHISINGVLSLAQGDAVGMYVRNVTDASNITIVEANVMLLRLV